MAIITVIGCSCLMLLQAFMVKCTTSIKKCASNWVGHISIGLVTECTSVI